MNTNDTYNLMVKAMRSQEGKATILPTGQTATVYEIGHIIITHYPGDWYHITTQKGDWRIEFYGSRMVCCGGHTTCEEDMIWLKLKT